VMMRFRKIYDQNLTGLSTLYPEVKETLRALPRDLPQAVASNKPGSWTRRILAEFGIDGAFRWVLGGDEVSARKPDPAILVELCKRADVDPARTLNVGDTGIDWETARAVKMPMALCTYGYGEAAVVERARAAISGDSAAVDGGEEAPLHLLDRFSQVL